MYAFVQLPIYQYVNGVQLVASRAYAAGARSFDRSLISQQRDDRIEGRSRSEARAIAMQPAKQSRRQTV